MKNRLLKLGLALISILSIGLWWAMPVYATVANPDAIAFGAPTSISPYYRAFYNVYQTGDMLFMAESYVHYASYTGIPPSNTAFLFELLSPDDSTVLASTPLWSYEDKPVSIYLTPAQVITLGLTVNSAYGLRITGNPLIFSTLAYGAGGNMVITHLSGSSDWFNQLLDTTDILTPLRSFGLHIMTNLQVNDVPSDAYITTISGVTYVTTVGSSIILSGVTGLETWCPLLFQFSVASIQNVTPPSSGAYAAQLNPTGQLGVVTYNGFKYFGLWLGLGSNGVMAGGIIYILLTLGAIVWMATKIQSPLVLPIGTVGMITIGAFLGFIPLALLFMVLALITILTAIYFFTRGFWT